MTDDEKIRDIIKDFDFEKVHECMTVLKWIWATAKTDNKVPSIGHLVLGALELLNGIKNTDFDGEEIVVRSTGGFTAEKYLIGKETTYKLYFVLTESESL